MPRRDSTVRYRPYDRRQAVVAIVGAVTVVGISAGVSENAQEGFVRFRERVVNACNATADWVLRTARTAVGYNAVQETPEDGPISSMQLSSAESFASDPSANWDAQEIADAQTRSMGGGDVNQTPVSNVVEAQQQITNDLSDTQSSKCSVCHEIIASHDKKWLPCAHYVCSGCFPRINRQCPECRTEFE